MDNIEIDNEKELIKRFDNLYPEIQKLISGIHEYDEYYSPQLYDTKGEEVSIQNYVNCVFMDVDMYIDIFPNRIELYFSNLEIIISTENYLTCSEEEMFMQSTLYQHTIFNNHVHVLEGLIRISLITRENLNEKNAQ